MKGIVDAKHIQHLFETLARRLEKRWILRCRARYDLVDLLS